MFDNVTTNASVIICYDVDPLLFEKIQQTVQAGFSVVEINTVDESLIKKVIHEFPMLRIGAGNVIDTTQLEVCYNAGVHFVTSPGFTPAIAQTANVYSIHYLPGIATISEAMQASAAGCQHVRPYPATLPFCSLLNKCLPLLRLYPAEVEVEETEHFLTLPAVAAVSILNPDQKQLKACRSLLEG